jgi:hypothetical protein
MSLPAEVSPKVFISYSWTSDEFADWVMNLARRLRHDGIDVVLDRWRLKAGQDKYVFMEQMAKDPEIQKVLMICDRRYTERADRREGGVGTESTIISQEIYNQVEQQKFIPVIAERGLDGQIYVPIFIKSRIYIDLSDPARFELGYENLLRTLTGRPASEEPPLGKLPVYLSETNSATAASTFALRAFESALMNDKRHTTGLARDYLDRLFETLEALQVENRTRKERIETDAAMLKRLADWDRHREEWISFLRLISRYGTDLRTFDSIPPFFELTLKLIPRQKSAWNQHLDFIIHEAFLYAVTIFLNEQRFDAVALLLNYHYREPGQTGFLRRYGIFASGDTRYLESVLNEEWSKQEKGIQYRYPQQRWLHMRANDNSITFELLKEADVILWLRTALETDSEAMFSTLSWFPVSIGSFQDYHSRVDGFPMFQRATSRSFFDKFKVVLGVDSKEEFNQRWARVCAHDPEISGGRSGQYWARVFNIEKLASNS